MVFSGYLLETTVYTTKNTPFREKMRRRMRPPYVFLVGVGRAS